MKKSLVWVYPPNNWKSEFTSSFIYGYSNPDAKLFVKHSINEKLKPVKVFPNGNFAQKIKLIQGKNEILLLQSLKNKKKTIKRTIFSEKIKKFPKSTNLEYQPLIFKFQQLTPNPVIVIDPGHGGKEHGTHSPCGIPESHFNLVISKLLFKELKKKISKVFITRTKDEFVSLDKRVAFAKKKKCNLFISIHHNALPDNEDPLKHKGVGIYYSHDSSKLLGKKLLDSISKKTKLKKYGIFKRNFKVIKSESYNGILIECGFLIHPLESEYITKKETQKKIVNGIIKGLVSCSR